MNDLKGKLQFQGDIRDDLNSNSDSRHFIPLAALYLRGREDSRKKIGCLRKEYLIIIACVALVSPPFRLIFEACYIHDL